jgi:erythromycin esterase
MNILKIIFTVILFVFSPLLLSQNDSNIDLTSKLTDLGEVTNNNEDFSTFEPLKQILENVDIVMLGEQSHGEATTYETKIKLIKFLHQEMGFDILAFESGFYDCKKAWDEIKRGEDVRNSLGKSIFSLWSSVNEFKPLVNYISQQESTKTPLIISGFDSQWTGKLSEENYIKDLKKYLLQINSPIVKTDALEYLEKHLAKLASYEFSKNYKKEDTHKAIANLESIITYLNTLDKNDDSKFWIQSLISTKKNISDVNLKTDFRDQQMAENLIWLKEQNPGKKIICWGATSHFIYNSSEVRMKSPIVKLIAGNYYQKHQMMGDYLKTKYNDSIYVIGFTAHEGHYGLTSKNKIKLPKKNSVEYTIGQSSFTNCLLPLKDIKFTSKISRPLGNMYMKNDISNIMDAVIFNRKMKRPRFDIEFLSEMYPENSYLKKIVEKRKAAAVSNSKNTQVKESI